MAPPPPPYAITQIEHTVEHVGRQKAASKRRIRWVFGVAPITNNTAHTAPSQHELVFTWSISSGKQDITLDGMNVTFSRQKGRSIFNERLHRMGERPDLRLVCTTTVPTGCPQDFVLYELLLDDVPYRCYPVAEHGSGRQEVYMGGSIGGLRPPGSVLDITDPGRYDGCGSPDYVPGGTGGTSARPAPGSDEGAMDISSGGDGSEHHVGFATVSSGDDLASHEYNRHRHDYPKTHFPGSTGDPENPLVAAAASEDAAMAAPPTESMDLLSFDAAPAPAATGVAPPTCDGMGDLVPTQQPQQQQQPPSSSYANDLLSFGAAPAAAEPAPPAAAAAADAPMVPADGHVSFTTLTTGDDLAKHEYDQHRHDYPKTHFPGSEGDPEASAFAGAVSSAGVNPFDQFESVAAPAQQGQQQQPPPPSGTSGGGSGDLLGFP